MALTKPRIIELLLVTTVPTMFVAERGVPSVWLMVATVVGGTLAAGDMVRIEAGCDKRFETCRYKFNNRLNYQGFPDIPGEDWLKAVPAVTGQTTGGSRR